MAISSCLRSVDDIEWIARESLIGQAEQIDAVNRARVWEERELGVRMGIIMDIPRLIPPEDGLTIADWAIERYGDGLIALGLGGPEFGNPPDTYRAAFDRVRAADIP